MMIDDRSKLVLFSIDRKIESNHHRPLLLLLLVVFVFGEFLLCTIKNNNVDEQYLSLATWLDQLGLDDRQGRRLLLDKIASENTLVELGQQRQLNRGLLNTLSL
jgi:hypothetical protein